MTDSTLVTAALAAIPSLVIGVVGYLLRRLIADLQEPIKQLAADLRQLRDSLGSLHTDLATLRVRIEQLERQAVVAQSERAELRHDLSAVRARSA